MGLGVYRLRLGGGPLSQPSEIPGGTSATPQVEPTSVAAAQPTE